MTSIEKATARKDRNFLVRYIVDNAPQASLRMGAAGEVMRCKYQLACVGLALLDGDSTGELTATFDLLVEELGDAQEESPVRLVQVSSM